MTTMFVLGMGLLAVTVVTGLAMAWALVRAVLWVVFLPLMLLKGAFGLVFGLVFGAFGLVIGLLATVLAGGIALLAILAVVALPLVPLLLVAAVVYLAFKGTAALAAA